MNIEKIPKKLLPLFILSILVVFAQNARADVVVVTQPCTDSSTLVNSYGNNLPNAPKYYFVPYLSTYVYFPSYEAYRSFMRNYYGERDISPKIIVINAGK